MKVLVREAEQADMPALLAMGRRFIESSAYAAHMAVVPSRQVEVVETLLAQGGCWVLESPDGTVVGMLGLVLAPLPLTGELAALEAMWWCEPEWRGHGARQMWWQAEDWAREQGATCIQMIQPVDNVRLGDTYRRAGYVPVETTWHKALAPWPSASDAPGAG